MVTLYFTRQFTKGNLKGICHHDKIAFPDLAHASSWLKGIKQPRKAKRLGYEVIDASFQNYVR